MSERKSSHSGKSRSKPGDRQDNGAGTSSAGSSAIGASEHGPEEQRSLPQQENSGEVRSGYDEGQDTPDSVTRGAETDVTQSGLVGGGGGVGQQDDISPGAAGLPQDKQRERKESRQQSSVNREDRPRS